MFIEPSVYTSILNLCISHRRLLILRYLRWLFNKYIFNFLLIITATKTTTKENHKEQDLNWFCLDFISIRAIIRRIWLVEWSCKQDFLYLRIFRLTTSQSQKLIPKADLKWEGPYLHLIFFKEFYSIFLKVKNGFSILFLKSYLTWVWFNFWHEKKFWESQAPRYMPKFWWQHAGSSILTPPS